MSSYYKVLIEFALKITRSAIEHGYEINFTASTTSIYMLLAMIHIGSKDKSSAQLETLLGTKFSSLLSDHPQKNPFAYKIVEIYKNLSQSGHMDSQIFTSVPLRQEYLMVLVELFHITPQQISFKNPSEAVGAINMWATEKTHGRINKMIEESDISPETVMMLINTVYFKGTWKYLFNEKLTHNEDFLLENGKKVNVPFMRRSSNAKVYINQVKQFQALILDFQQENYSGIFILPDEETTLKKIISVLKAEDLKSCLDKGYENNVDISIPKFKIDKIMNMKNVLKYLGITKIFNDENALGKMSNRHLLVEDIIHHSTVEIDENGAVAAAASVALFSARSFDIENSFRANRPFIFVVVDKKTGMPLFINAITNPSRS